MTYILVNRIRICRFFLGQQLRNQCRGRYKFSLQSGGVLSYLRRHPPFYVHTPSANRVADRTAVQASLLRCVHGHGQANDCMRRFVQRREIREDPCQCRVCCASKTLAKQEGQCGSIMVISDRNETTSRNFLCSRPTCGSEHRDPAAGLK